MDDSLKEKDKQDYEEFKEVLQIITDYFEVTELAAIAIIRYFITIQKKSFDILKRDDNFLVPKEKLLVIRKQMSKHKAKLLKLNGEL